MVWDPVSVSQTNRLGALVRNLVDTYPTISSTSKNTVNLLEAISAKIVTSLDEDTFMPLYSKELVVSIHSVCSATHSTTQLHLFVIF